MLLQVRSKCDCTLKTVCSSSLGIGLGLALCSPFATSAIAACSSGTCCAADTDQCGIVVIIAVAAHVLLKLISICSVLFTGSLDYL